MNFHYSNASPTRFSILFLAANPDGADSAADTTGQPEEGGGTPAAPPARKCIWTERAGQRQIEAEFVRLEDARIRLRRGDGREFSLPFEFFIDNDRRVASQLAQQDESRDEETK